MKHGASAREVLFKLVPRRAAGLLRRAVDNTTFPVDFSSDDIALYRSVSAFTMTSPERIVALRDAVHYVARNGIAGDVVECGVWRGGSMMVVARTLLEHADLRTLHLFDTFEGMPPPGPLDVAWHGKTAAQELLHAQRKPGRTMWCIADEADVRGNMETTGYPLARVQLVRGRVEQTLPAQAPAQIALLRLDTDWYESTRHELIHLYPRLSRGGVLIIDDYGHWQGARRAVDEYLATLSPAPLLTRIDETGRLLIKP